ncbi:DUF1465 family protein [Sphingopyxis sp. MWB1]|uniref:DUF1465 family protein n=1 Tax=Sphingopyxis sp. MWB1 TaxID=1537715 RepID=UPI000691C421|nr:DUF1465 family protein [Sphingopyxis sp. MWB1]
MASDSTDETPPCTPVQRAQVENLYVEAMLLADEAQAVFAVQRDRSTPQDDPLLLVGLACEALKTTTRLMHVIAWLLHRRAMIAGEPGATLNDSAAHIGEPVAADWDICQYLDVELRRIVAASERLFERVAMLETGWNAPAVAPVQGLIARLRARL